MDEQNLSFRGFSEPRGARVSVWFEERFGEGAFVKVLTLATKRLNARRREIDRRAFFVSTQFLAGFERFSRSAGPGRRPLCLQRDFRLSNATFKVAPVSAKNRPRTL